MGKVFIYGLREINSNVIRYVGKTKNIKNRLYEHIKDAKLGVKTHKCYWINKVIKSGSMIEIDIIEEVDEERWPEREIFWIDKLNKDLTNSAKGGMGGCRYTKYNLTYNELKELIQKNYPNIKTRKEYVSTFRGVNKPKEIPNDPFQVYETNGWVSWGDFLGSDNVSGAKLAKNYLSYEKCKEWVKKNMPHIKSGREWKKMVKTVEIPLFIPKDPESFYKIKNGNFSFMDFLSIKKRYKPLIQNYFSYNELKNWNKENLPTEINSAVKWLCWRRLNKNFNRMPGNPPDFYKKRNEWVSWYDFLNK